MDPKNASAPTEEESVVVENWPVSLEATREQLKKALKRLDRYKAAMRLANVEIERRNRSLLALTNFTYQATRTANLPGLLKLSLIQALETTNTTVGAVVLIDKETKELNLGVHKGLTPELSQILTGQQLQQGAVALMPHLVAGAGALLEYQTSTDKMERRLLYVGRLTSLVSLPLQLGPQLVGALLVGLQENRTFTPAELCFLMALSQELAIALESVRLREGLWLTAEALLNEEIAGTDLQHLDNATLHMDVDISTPFELPPTAPTAPEPADDDLEQLLAAMMEAEDEVQRQNTDLQTLNTVAEMMNRTLDIRDILQSAVDQTQTTLNVDAAWLYQVDESNHLEIRAYNGLSLEYVRGMQRIKMGSEIEGQTAAENKALFIESVTRDYPKHKIWVDKEKLHAVATMPITRPDSSQKSGEPGSHVIGVLAVGKKDVQSHLWSPREIRLLTSIANQMALAINNAQLYAQVQEHETGLRAGNEVLRTVNDMLLEKNAFLEGFLQEDLIPALTVASPVLQHLLAETTGALTETQKQNLATLKQVISRLNTLARETGEISLALDTAMGDTFDDQEEPIAPKPIRLEKKDTGKPNLPANQPDSPSTESSGTQQPENDAPPKQKPADKDIETPSQTPSKPMSFEEAVAAGLVPAHILNRDSDS